MSSFRDIAKWLAAIDSQRLRLLAGISLIATSAIVASAVSGSNQLPWEALLGQTVAASQAPEVTGGSDSAAGGSSSGAGGAEEGTISFAPEADLPPSAAPAPTPTPTPTAPTDDTPTDPTDPTDPDPDPDPDPTDPTDPTDTGPPGPVRHVFVISLTSPGYEPVFGEESEMPFLSEEMRPRGQLLSHYSLLTRNPLPNLVGMISGQQPNKSTRADCPTYSEFPSDTAPDRFGRVPGAGCVYPVQALTLADQIGSATLSWHAYMEDMADPQFGPGPCVRPGPDEREEVERGGYTVKHNPFAYFHSLLDLGDCATNDVPLTDLRKDLRDEATTSDFSFISPNLCNSGRTGECEEGEPDGPAAADAFLKKWVPIIEDSPAFEKDGLLIVTFGETEAPQGAAEPRADAEDPAADGAGEQGAADEADESLRVGTLLYSKYVSAGSTNGAEYGPYSILRSVEDLLGLDHLVAASSEDTRSFAGQFLALGAEG